MCIYIYIYIYKYVYACMHTYMHSYTLQTYITYAHRYIDTCMHVYIYISYVYMYESTLYVIQCHCCKGCVMATAETATEVGATPERLQRKFYTPSRDEKKPKGSEDLDLGAIREFRKVWPMTETSDILECRTQGTAQRHIHR